MLDELIDALLLYKNTGNKDAKNFIEWFYGIKLP